MRLDLIYIEGEHDEVPGIVRELALDEKDAKRRTEHLLNTGSHVYRQEMSVELKDAFSYLEVEAAQCVWEHICEITVCAEEPDPIWREYREAHGSVQLRHESIAIGQWALKVYDLLPEWYRETGAYDWEIIPAIVSVFTPGEDFPEPEAATRILLNAEDAKQHYLRDANFHLKNKYSIDFLEGGGLSEEEFFTHWFDPDVDPEEQAKRFAEKYDLEET
ncbi:hypothetical protein [Mesorhizobium sp. WSM2239]|uniref:YubB ferredoxin-like domain-containing protein n=2 Tax=unclassified Mesorhizobium TaxID=325217 RepID=A0AAU8DEI0_9HYPH